MQAVRLARRQPMLTDTERRAEEIARQMAKESGMQGLWELFLPAAYDQLFPDKNEEEE